MESCRELHVNGEKWQSSRVMKGSPLTVGMVKERHYAQFRVVFEMGMIICFPSLGEKVSWSLLICSHKPLKKPSMEKLGRHVNFYGTKDTEQTNPTTVRVLGEDSWLTVLQLTTSRTYGPPFCVCSPCVYGQQKSTGFKKTETFVETHEPRNI